ncbi:MAG: methyl-accepting chemotaxis protein, partial [Opitutales bacterium]|nr:methyl-accepting chemotaxis protein [Opitutales bacterium]
TVKVRSRDGKREISRMVTYTMYEPWRWIIGTSLDADEFSGSESALISRIGYFTRRVGYAGAIFTLLAIGVAWILASQMSKPLKLLRKVARYHSRGDMLAAGAALESYTEKGGSRIEEFDTLIRGISDMTSTLSSLIKSVRDDGESAAAGAEKISALALAMESVALSEVASIRRVATTGKAISLSADSINKEARASASQVAKTLEIGRECGDSLQSLKRNYDALYAAAEGITRRLSIIDGNAEKITSVATAIAEINKRTNILSLNASIEAEKAGEVGLGFAVVARQIRRLADKTSKSASDIEIAVKQMQSAVNSGVMEMDRFGASMRQSLKIVLETADSLSRVVGDVEGIAPKFENIAMRISALSENARGIGETMTALSGSSVTARDTAMEFKSATAALGATSDSLLGEVSRFKVSEGGGAK